MVGFDGVPFHVVPDTDGSVPLPIAGAGNGPRQYDAHVRTANGADLTTLETAKMSIVSVVPALGFVSGGTLVVEAGPGARTLVYPAANGSEVSVSAILIGVADRLGYLTAAEWRATLTFLLLE